MRMLLAVIVLVSLAAVVEAQAPIITIGPNGQSFGGLSANPYDPSSLANPYGRFGSRFSPDSINNPSGQWGSPYSPNSVTNPFSTRGPRVMQPNRPMMPPGW